MELGIIQPCNNKVVEAKALKCISYTQWMISDGITDDTPCNEESRDDH